MVLRAFAIPERDVGVPRAGRGVHFHVQPISSGHTEDSWDLQDQESPTTSPFAGVLICVLHDGRVEEFCVCVCIVLRGALVQLCCTIAFVKFDTHRAGPRWTGLRYSDSEEFLRPRKFLGIRHPSGGWSQPRIFSPASVSDGFALRRIYVWGGQGSGRAGNRRRQKHPDPPTPRGGGGRGTPGGGVGGYPGGEKNAF